MVGHRIVKSRAERTGWRASAAAATSAALATLAGRAEAQDCGLDWRGGAPGGAAPSQRYNAAVAYDADRRRVVLFGGTANYSVSLNDTWEYDGSAWTHLAPAHSPPPREEASFLYIPARGVCMLLGGRDDAAGSSLSDVWQWDGSDWSPMSFSGPSPSAREAAGMVLDSVRQLVLLVNGTVTSLTGPNVYLRETWRLDLATSTWVLAGSAPDIQDFGLAYDPTRQRAVLFGGQIGSTSTWVNQTWQLDDVTGQWAQSPAVGPSARILPGMCFDSALGKAVVHGGNLSATTIASDTWAFDGSSWMQITTPGSFGSESSVILDDPAWSRIIGILPNSGTGAVWSLGSNLPAINTQPVDTTACAGTLAELFVTTDPSLGPYNFQWYKDGQPVGGNAFGITFPSVSGSDAGTYTCRVSNACGSVQTRPAVLTVNTAPVIIGSPVDRFVCPNGNTFFGTLASGGGPYTYQWRKNQQNISGANQNILYINNAQPADSGVYDCVVGNACGSTTTISAILAVGTWIRTQPSPVSVAPCDPAQFTVQAAGPAPLTYRWRLNGVPLTDNGHISGSQTATLSIDHAHFEDEGTYDVVVTSGCGPATSTGAALALSAPRVWTQVQAFGPAWRHDHAMAFDRARGKTVLFGGNSSTSGNLGDTWEYDGASWRLAATSGPVPRWGAAMGYDEARHVCVLFGGESFNGFNYDLADTWEWNGTAWTQRNAASGPEVSHYRQMAYDTGAGKLVMYGGWGYGGGPQYRDTWEYDGATGMWTRTAQNGPPVSNGWNFVYDRARQVRVVVTGQPGTSNERTFEFDPSTSTWPERTFGGYVPGPMSGVSAAYDEVQRRALLATGWFIGCCYSTITTGYNGTAWQLIQNQNNPHQRTSAAMVYDSVRHRMVLFGGFDNSGFQGNDTWEFGGIDVPAISQQPQAQVVFTGGTATFTVVAQGGTPVSYRWRQGGVPVQASARITGTTGPTLRISQVQSGDAGAYDCVLTDACGATTSATALLTVRCYANCDGSTTAPVLNVNDFTCFLNRFAAGDAYANCDGSTTPPVLNVNDFTCFLNAFAAGCS